MRNRLLSKVIDFFVLAHIRDNINGFAALSRCVRNDLLQRCFITRGQYYLRASLGSLGRDFKAEAAGGTGHDNRLFGKRFEGQLHALQEATRLEKAALVDRHVPWRQLI